MLVTCPARLIGCKCYRRSVIGWNVHHHGNYLIHAAKSADWESAKSLQNFLGPNWKVYHGTGIRKAPGCSQILLSDVQNHDRAWVTGTCRCKSRSSVSLNTTAIARLSLIAYSIKKTSGVHFKVCYCVSALAFGLLSERGVESCVMETWWRHAFYRPYRQRSLSRSQCGVVGLFREVSQSDVESKQAVGSRWNVIRLLIRSSIFSLTCLTAHMAQPFANLP